MMDALKNSKTRVKMYMKAFRRFVPSTFRSFTPPDPQRTFGALGIACGDAGLEGSFSLFGGYMRVGYPNWATKYFVDALLLYRVEHERDK